jgi:hypothetical protein
MAYQMTITMNEQEYAQLIAEATRRGKQPEALLLDLMTEHLPPAIQAEEPLTGQELAEKQYQEGKLLNLARPKVLTLEELAERERLGRLFAGDRLMSDMIIEDRGPY